MQPFTGGIQEKKLSDYYFAIGVIARTAIEWKNCAENQEVIDWLYQRTTGKFQ